MNGKLSFFVYVRNRLYPSLVAKPFKVAICVGWCARDIERIKPFYSLLVFDDRALYFQLSEPLFLALTLVPMDLDEQTVPCCCVYTCQLQEVHPRWQQCHFGIPSSFTPDHTCRWKSQEHLWSQGGGSDWEKRCQMDILTCRGGLKTLEVSTMKIYKACALCTDSHCDWNPVALSGNNSGTRQRQVDLQLWPKDEVSYQGTKVWQDFCLLGWVWPSLCWWCGLTLACLTGGLLLIYLTWNPPSAT